MTSEWRVTIAAGGTGGHIFPALALADELQRRGVDVRWMGTRRGLEAELVPKAGLPLDFIEVQGVRGKGVAAQLRAPMAIARAVLAARRLLHAYQPQVVVGLGGYVAGPAGLAAKLMRLPLVIHEQNAAPGSTNKWLAKFADRVLLGFPDALPGGEWIGNPVRRQFFECRRELPHTSPLNLLVLGGSLGAQALNERVPEALASLAPEQRPRVVHQAGAKHLEAAQRAYAQAGVEGAVVPFIDDMAGAMAAADLVICRAGALTCAELCAVGAPAVLVPFPHAIDDHQAANARHLVESGAAIMVRQNALDSTTLAQLIAQLSADPTRLAAMSVSARQLAKPEAAHRFADICLEYNHA